MSNQTADIHRVSPGGFAITVFVGSTLYLGLSNHGWQTLLTFKTVIFLLLGVFFSVLLVGVPFHLLRVRMEKFFLKPAGNSAPSTKTKKIKAATTLLMVVQVVVTFYATKLAYHWYFS